VLTISAEPGFLAAGGTIQLFREEARLRFAISAEHASAAGLAPSSRLLALSAPAAAVP
jgi:hypothetical protein